MPAIRIMAVCESITRTYRDGLQVEITVGHLRPDKVPDWSAAFVALHLERSLKNKAEIGEK